MQCLRNRRMRLRACGGGGSWRGGSCELGLRLWRRGLGAALSTNNNNSSSPSNNTPNNNPNPSKNPPIKNPKSRPPPQSCTPFKSSSPKFNSRTLSYRIRCRGWPGWLPRRSRSLKAWRLVLELRGRRRGGWLRCWLDLFV
jgi:hypothetical protein